MDVIYKTFIAAFIVSSCGSNAKVSDKSQDYKAVYTRNIEEYNKNINPEVYNENIPSVMTQEGKILSPMRALPQQ